MSGDNNLALVMKMGAPRKLGYNPIAPRSHRWMMDVSQRDEVVRLVGWALWRTVDLDPLGDYGPIKKKRTHFAHDARCIGTKHKFLGIDHAAEDLGMTVANATDALRRAVEQKKLLVDEDGRISPNGNTPEPRRIKGKQKSKEQQEEARKENEVFFCTEKMPPSLVERFQQLSINEASQYRVLYSKIPKPLSQRLKKLPPEKRTTDTWRLLEGFDYRDQLMADAMTISRRAGDYVVDQIYSEIGYEEKEQRGRTKKELDFVTVELKPRVSFREFSVQKKAKKAQDSVQNRKPIPNRKGKEAVQKQASLFDFSEFYRPSSEKDFTQSSEAGRQEGDMPARLPLDPLRELFPNGVLLDADLKKLDEYFVERLGTDYNRERFIEVVRKRAKRGISTGLLFEYEKGLPNDFCELAAQEAKRAHVSETKLPEPTVAEQITSLEGMLAMTPDHSQASAWREQLAELKQRKPAESEGKAKAQKAGQG